MKNKIDITKEKKSVKDKYDKVKKRILGDITLDDTDNHYEAQAIHDVRHTPGTVLFGYPDPVFRNPNLEALLDDIQTVCGA